MVAYAPGGSADIMARLLSEPLGRALGTTVVVENKPGGAGIVGSEACARAPADGYTICFGSTTTHSILFFLHGGKLPYDPEGFHRPDARRHATERHRGQSQDPGHHPAGTDRLGKAHPGAGYATAGIGTSNHLIGAYLTNGKGPRHLPRALPQRRPGHGAAVAGEVPIDDRPDLDRPALPGQRQAPAHRRYQPQTVATPPRDSFDHRTRAAVDQDRFLPGAVRAGRPGAGSGLTS